MNSVPTINETLCTVLTMTIRPFIVSLLCIACSLRGAAQDPVVQSVIDGLQIDSMIHYVEELTGETMIDVGNGPELIVSRNKFNSGNAVAQAYIEQKLTQFGYAPTVQVFSTTGGNVIATKTGLLYPDEYVILCAHFDALPAGAGPAPAADDDGSGTAALLEAARVLSDIPFAYSIVFGFWDEEEQGLVGSGFYAGAQAANDVVIKGVVNMDAIAYDGNADRKARVHVRPIANSLSVSDTVVAVLDRYNFDIDLIVTNPGATYSDHASFWNEGYSAVLMIEEFTGDGNPTYHTQNDRVEFFDVPYYETLAKLSIASFATLAVPYSFGQAVEEVAVQIPALFAFPNPVSENSQLYIEAPMTDRYSILLVDALGKEVSRLHDGVLSQGKHVLPLPMGTIAPGTYSVLARPDNGKATNLRVMRSQ